MSGKSRPATSRSTHVQPAPGAADRSARKGVGRRPQEAGVELGHPNNRSNLNELPPWLPVANPDPLFDGETPPALRWDHLIYAYMVANTRVVEIVRKVLFELAHGEKLGSPLAESQPWVRTTEELFFKPGAPFLITSVASQLREDFGGIGRNAFKRMFDMELNHGGADGKPYSYVKADAANSDFVATFEEFLREVWVGMTYVTATSSSNPTDPAKIAALATKLHDMLRSRRQNGNLSREEFALVSRCPGSISHWNRILRSYARCAPKPPVPTAFVQDRRARGHASARVVEALPVDRRPDISDPHPDRDGRLQQARSRACAVHTGQSLRRHPRIGATPDHHRLDRDHRPRCQGAQGGHELISPSHLL